MAKAYLIGGTPRAGKTTLTIKFIKQKPMLAASTDAIRYTLRRVIDKEKEPDLFKSGKFISNDPAQRHHLITHVHEVVEQQNDESKIVWKSVQNFINSNLEDGFDVLVEGVAILPELVKQADFDYSAVFLGNQSDEHFRTILNSARGNPNDWLHKLDDETIQAYCCFGQQFSKYIENEAKKNDLPYIETSDTEFNQSMDLALCELLKV